MRIHVTLAAAAAATVLLVSSAHAQTRGGTKQSGTTRTAESQSSGGKSLEFGLDGSVGFAMNGPSTTTVQLPISQLRVAFQRTPNWSIEPMLRLNYEGTDGQSGNELFFGVGALSPLSQDRSQKQWYARPYVAIDHQSVTFDVGGNSQTQSSNRL